MLHYELLVRNRYRSPYPTDISYHTQRIQCMVHAHTYTYSTSDLLPLTTELLGRHAVQPNYHPHPHI